MLYAAVTDSACPCSTAVRHRCSFARPQRALQRALHGTARLSAALRPIVPLRLKLTAAVVAVVIALAAHLDLSGGEMNQGAAAEPRERAALPEPAAMRPEPSEPDVENPRWRASKALGTPTAGRLVRGVQLPSEGSLFYTWDHVRRRSPNRGWRRFGTDRLVRTVLAVVEDHRGRYPGAPRVGIGDLSRPRGGDFGPRFGAPGHASHQNGLDVDIYYPRRDGRERPPSSPRQIDRRLAQDLVERFVRAGARFVFVGFKSGLTGPRRVVQAIPHHDNHLHVRIRPR
jgi:Penicillin-insensitive murein endopeptidase